MYVYKPRYSTKASARTKRIVSWAWRGLCGNPSAQEVEGGRLLRSTSNLSVCGLREGVETGGLLGLAGQQPSSKFQALCQG